MIKAVIIMPAYTTATADNAAEEAVAKEIRRAFNLQYTSKLQWTDVVVLNLEDDPKPYRDLPVLTLGDYAYIRAKYWGCLNVTRMPDPRSKDFEGCGAFTKLNKAAGEKLRWGVKDGDA